MASLLTKMSYRIVQNFGGGNFGELATRLILVITNKIKLDKFRVQE